jgi:signal peptidase I
MDKKNIKLEHPSLSLIENELRMERRKQEIKKTILFVVGSLISVSAVFVLLSLLFFPVVRVNMNSMKPNLHEGDIILLVSTRKVQRDDLIAFKHNNIMMVKRVVAFEGETVDINDEGVVFVNGNVRHEPFLNELNIGKCNIPLPLIVPEERLFVIGDNRGVSIDSRSIEIGPIDVESQLVGKALIRIWPIARISVLNRKW